MTDEEPNIAYICKGISENCINPDSYGYICVGCNQCGRFDETKLDENKIKQIEKEG